jgi:ribulose-5-phosphate 4-epimerase/fuculose-1-phosphate aldolase
MHTDPARGQEQLTRLDAFERDCGKPKPTKDEGVHFVGFILLAHCVRIVHTHSRRLVAICTRNPK